MLYLLAQLSIQSADACTPMDTPAELLNSFPTNGSLLVPINAVIQLEFTSGVLSEEDDFLLRQDDVELEIEVRKVLHNTSIIGAPAIFEIAPVGLMMPDQEFVLEQNGERVMTFVTSKELASPVDIVPVHSWIDQYFVDNSYYEDLSNCEPETQTDISIQFDGLSSEHAVVIQRVDVNGVFIDAEDEEPFMMLLDSSEDYVYFSEMHTDAGEEFCFVAAFVNEAGDVGEFSTAVCASEYLMGEWRCGIGNPFGCSSIPASDFAWMSLAFGILGLVRRRK
jgi:hypothetical protein